MPDAGAGVMGALWPGHRHQRRVQTVLVGLDGEEVIGPGADQVAGVRAGGVRSVSPRCGGCWPPSTVMRWMRRSAPGSGGSMCGRCPGCGRPSPLMASRVCGTVRRGPPAPGGAGVHLLAVLTPGDGQVLAQRQVDPGTSEIAWFIPLAGWPGSDRVGGDRRCVAAGATYRPQRQARPIPTNASIHYGASAAHSAIATSEELQRPPPRPRPPRPPRRHDRLKRCPIPMAAANPAPKPDKHADQ